MMILSINPINAVLFLISTFLSTAMILFMLNVEFLAMILIIIYVGAIAVLFLFIVMMLNIKKLEKDNFTYLTIGSIILFFFSLYPLSLYLNPLWLNSYFNDTNFIYSYASYNMLDESLRLFTLRQLGVILFYEKPLYILLAGFILLLAVIGSIYLTNEKRGFSVKSQYIQLSRNKNIKYAVYF